jgi:hypothetical protein
VARDWQSHAKALAKWTYARLVARYDVHGQYLALEARTESRKAVTRRGPPTLGILAEHYRGKNVGDLVGLPSTSAENECRFAVVDIDQHDAKSFEEKKRRNRAAAIRLHDRLASLGFHPLLESSNGKGGYHVWIVFAVAVASELVFRFVRWLIRDWQSLGLDSPPDTFPRQSRLGGGVQIGNWIRLFGRHHTFNFFSQLWDRRRWLKGAEAIAKILATTGDSPSLIPRAVREFRESSAEPGSTHHERPRIPENDWLLPPIERVLSRLGNVTDGAGQWYARCPAHADRRNSLSVAVGDDGIVLLKCHAGCQLEEITDALELFVSDLFPRTRSALRTRRRPTGSAIRSRPAPRRSS